MGKRIVAKVLVIAAIASTLLMCDRHEAASGRWEVRRAESLPESGGGRLKLYRHATFGTKLVDDLVVEYQFDSNDCVMYKAFHGTGPSSRQLFGVCDDRRPVLLAGDWSEPPIEISPEGAIQWLHFGLVSGQVVREGRRVTWPDLRHLADTQPRFEEGWQSEAQPQRDVFRDFVHPVNPSDIDESGRSMLELAIIDGAVDVVQKMVRDEGHLPARFKHGYSPLHLAVATDDVTMVQALIELGADANAIDVNGSSVIQEAATRGQPEIIRLLVAAGAAISPELQKRIQTDPRLR